MELIVGCDLILYCRSFFNAVADRENHSCASSCYVDKGGKMVYAFAIFGVGLFFLKNSILKKKHTFWRWYSNFELSKTRIVCVIGSLPLASSLPSSQSSAINFIPTQVATRNHSSAITETFRWIVHQCKNSCSLIKDFKNTYPHLRKRERKLECSDIIEIFTRNHLEYFGMLFSRHCSFTG